MTASSWQRHTGAGHDTVLVDEVEAVVVVGASVVVVVVVVALQSCHSSSTAFILNTSSPPDMPSLTRMLSTKLATENLGSSIRRRLR